MAAKFLSEEEVVMDLLDELDALKLERETAHLTNDRVFFPDLAWEKVVGKIQYPKDIKSCSNASPFFWKLLKPNRETKVLVPLVLQQLSLFFNKYKSDGNDGGTDSDNGKLSMTDFWKLREVCKTWNTVIEHLHHSSEAGHFEMRDALETSENLHLYPFAHDVFDPREALPQRFLEHFDHTHYDLIGRKPKKNPFLGRSVQFICIILGNPAEDEDFFYLIGISEMLRKYGAEIWYAYFDFGDISGINLVEIYSRLVEFLKLTPNLKVLHVNCERDNSDDDDDDDEELQERRRVVRRSRNQTRQNPIPKLPQLEYLMTMDLPTQIFNELLLKNRHISKLQVDRKIRHPDYSIFKVYLPNLTDLGVTFSSLKAFKKFEKCRIPFSLERFYFRFDGSSERLSWSRLIHALDIQLGKNCIELLIQMPLHKTEHESIQTFDDTHFGRLNLVNLEHIEIKCNSAISLDFLLPAKHSLRTIFVSYLNGNDDGFLLKRFAEYEEKQVVKFIGFKERMEDSNIWEKFPMLEDITLFRKRDMGGCISYTCDRRIKGDCVMNKERWYFKTI